MQTIKTQPFKYQFNALNLKQKHGSEQVDISSENNPLAQKIIQLIERVGPITVDQFMDIVLYDNEYGYYHAPRLASPMGGFQSDYITAPDISQLFGECIAFWFLDIWIKTDLKAPIHLIEFGPGKGTLMADILRTVNQIRPSLINQLTVHLFEVSPTLQQKQKSALASYNCNFQWYQDIHTVKDLNVPFNEPVFFIANEFFDALPIKQYIFIDDTEIERTIQIKSQGQLNFLSSDEKVVREYCPQAYKIIEDLCTLIRNRVGAGLIIDYGFYEPTPNQSQDTLQAMRGHQYADIFEHLGKTDLTHHVNFKAFKEMFEKNNISVLGPTYQGTFLKELEIETRAEQLRMSAQGTQYSSLLSALTRLCAPSHMGHLFKVLGFTSHLNIPIGGFNTCLD